MKELILIKLGGSLITDKNKPFTQNQEVTRRVCQEIHQAKTKTDIKFLVGHGGGSYPHTPASKFQTHLGIINGRSLRGIAEVQDAASRLNRIVVKEFLKAGENAISISPSSCMLTKDGFVKEGYLRTIFKFLDFGLLPVIYGDVVLDTKKGCAILSTERILNFLAKNSPKFSYKVIKIIHTGDTNGVYDHKGKTISVITPDSFKEFQRAIRASGATDVTGGMLHKVKESLEIAQLGISSLIINGKTPGNLNKAILGKEVKGSLIR